MTEEEVRASLEGLSARIDRYAELLVRKGVAIQQGQELVISIPVELASFARLLARKGYDCGAGHVTVLWSDTAIARLEYENMDVEYFAHIPTWKRDQLNGLAKDGAAFLFVEASDPQAFAGVDAAKPVTRMRATREQCKEYRNGLDFGHNTWCIAGAPVEAWACTVFPQYGPKEATYYLWEAILAAARSNSSDPQAEWERHNAMFEKNKRLLNGYAFDRLHYVSSNGTDFELGMNQGHEWAGGSGRTVDGVVFFPNMPTEEVFTSPDRNRAQGIVRSAMPLVHAGRVVRDFWFRFDQGQVVEYDAAEGRDVLEEILGTDKNASRLGECALISKDTPIRQSGLLFYSTLYDENASCHLALGTGFPECLQGGLAMSRDELIEHGVNQSSTHVDFMIGADDLCVYGITPSGDEVPVFEDGRWAWAEE